MRLLHVIPDLDLRRGGPSVSVLGLAKSLAQSGNEVSIVTSGGDSGRHRDCAADAVMVVFLERSVGVLCELWSCIRSFSLGSQSDSIVIIHSLWNLWTTVSAAACRFHDMPYIIVPHGMLSDDALRRSGLKKRIYYFLIDRKTVSSAFAVRFLTDLEREKSLQGWVEFGRSFIVSNGVDQLTREKPIDIGDLAAIVGRRFFVFLGRIHEIKNIELQVHALVELRREFPDVKLVIIGPDAGHLSKLMDTISCIGMEEAVVFVGAVNDARRFDLLARSVALVQTSFHEAHSMSVNEALACSVPVIITKGVNYDAVAQVGAGLVVESDPMAVVRAMKFLLNDPVARERMGQNGRAYARTMLDWDAIARDFAHECSLAVREARHRH